MKKRPRKDERSALRKSLAPRHGQRHSADATGVRSVGQLGDGSNDVMQIRSIEGWGEPAWVIASTNACERLGPDPRKAFWPAEPEPKRLRGLKIFGPDLSTCIHRSVDSSFELAVDPQRAVIGKGEDLRHENSGDAPTRINPVIGVKQAAPGQAAGAATVWTCLHVDHVAEAPFETNAGK